jgi:hypothetical protein
MTVGAATGSAQAAALTATPEQTIAGETPLPRSRVAGLTTERPTLSETVSQYCFTIPYCTVP